MRVRAQDLGAVDRRARALRDVRRRGDAFDVVGRETIRLAVEDAGDGRRVGLALRLEAARESGALVAVGDVMGAVRRLPDDHLPGLGLIPPLDALERRRDAFRVAVVFVLKALRVDLELARLEGEDAGRAAGSRFGRCSRRLQFRGRLDACGGRGARRDRRRLGNYFLAGFGGAGGFNSPLLSIRSSVSANLFAKLSPPSSVSG